EHGGGDHDAVPPRPGPPVCRVGRALTEHGLDRVLTTVAGGGPDGLLGDLRLTGTTALSANLVDNLPAYVAMEPVADNTGHRLILLLLGVNCGWLLALGGGG